MAEDIPCTDFARSVVRDELRRWQGEEESRRSSGTAKLQSFSWQDLVRRLAYKVWEERGRPDFSDGGETDWRKAEKALREQLTEDVRKQIEGQAAVAFTFDGGLLVPEDYGRLLLPEPPQNIFASLHGLLSSVATGSRDLIDLNWREFEDLMAEILEGAGWSIRPMGYTKDGGIDIVAVRKVHPGIPFEMMVQCKRHARSNPVGIAVVREVWSVKWRHAFHQAMIATTSRFTKGARKQAEGWNLDLREHNEIVQWCKRIHQGFRPP